MNILIFAKQKDIQMIKTLILTISIAAAIPASAQLTLSECQRLAHDNYPAIRQYRLTEQSRDYTVENAAKGWMPQVSLSARATYQSDVTQIPIRIPGIDMSGLGMSKDQYDASATVSQAIFDGGKIASAQRTARAEAEVSKTQTDVTLYSIRERVEQLFFGVLTIDVQSEQTQLLLNDLEISRRTVESLIRGGMASQTDADAISVERLQTEQRQGSLAAQRRSYLTMLGSFIGRELSGSTKLTTPLPSTPSPNPSTLIPNPAQRPELSMYDARLSLLNAHEKTLDTRLRPQIGAFLTGGYGRPGLNMLKDKFALYYKVGVSMTWNFGALYTRKNDKLRLATERQSVETERATFLLNNRLQRENAEGTLADLQQQITRDEEIVTLRERILATTRKKVSGGTETVNELLRKVNDVSRARLQKALHKVQLMREEQRLRTINGEL